MPCIARAAAVVLLFVFAPTVSAASETFRAQGNEPSWSLRKTEQEITFSAIGGRTLVVAPVPASVRQGDSETFSTAVAGTDFSLVLVRKLCTDTMSGMPFPTTVTVIVGPDTFRGCGGEPLTLLRGAWRITAVNGKPIIDKTEPTIDFAAGGAVNGNGSCNRFFGSYALSGEKLSLGQVGSSMMMCSEPIMEQEHTVLDILKSTSGFGIGADGTLVIHSADGRTMTGIR